MQNQNYNPNEKPFSWEEYKKQDLAGEEDKEKRFVEGKKMEKIEQVSAEKDGAYQNVLSKVQTTQSQNDDNDLVKDEANYVFQKRTRDEQVKHLVEMALEKGVAYAVKVAEKTNDLYVLDRLHDTLVTDDLHKALLEKGLIDKI